jgi:hypothetical protein
MQANHRPALLGMVGGALRAAHPLDKQTIVAAAPSALLESIEQLPRNNPRPGDRCPLTPPG